MSDPDGLSNLFRAWGILGRGESAGNKPSSAILSCQTHMVPKPLMLSLALASSSELHASRVNFCLFPSDVSPHPFLFSLFSSPKAACWEQHGGSEE